jgi:hypothetical protein
MRLALNDDSRHSENTLNKSTPIFLKYVQDIFAEISGAKIEHINTITLALFPLPHSN